MMYPHFFRLVVWVVVLSSGAAAMGQPGGGDAVAAIQRASNMSEAGKAYLAALDADRKNPQVYQAYISKLLELGQARVAVPAAEQLRKLDNQQDNALAAGVIGYNLASRHKIGEALPHLVRAAKGDPDNSGLIHNIATLSVWVARSDEKAGVPNDGAALVGEVSEQMKSKDGYEQAAAAATAAFDNRANAAKALQDKLPEYQDALNRANSEGSQLEARWGQLQTQWNTCDSNFRQAQQDLQRVISASGYSQLTPEQQLSSRRLYEDRMRQARSEAARVDQERNRVKALNIQRQQRIKKAQRDIEIATKAIEQAGKRDPVLEWKPPAVNGKMIAQTPDAQPPAAEPPAAVPPAGEGEGKAAAVPDGAPDAAVVAQLKRAKLFLANDMRAKAVKLLEEIIDKHPGTDAAKEAEELLNKR
ncbi:MAG: hypothetical protein ABFD92_00910 [Planctomycetaceae bacterium]|nr:hypothetical protein [Planctomycetaceae bacterium]